MRHQTPFIAANPQDEAGQTAPLLASKLCRAQVPSRQVLRSALIRRLDEALRSAHRLSLVSGPAGYGKTTLVAQWLSATERASAWLTLDEGDNHPERFLGYLLTALDEVDTAITQSAWSVLESLPAPPVGPYLTTLLNDIAAVDKPFILVLDDYHTIQARPVHGIIRFLVEHQPPQMHLVVVTREDPPLGLAKWRARNQLTEIGLPDLRFTAQEADTFLATTMELELAPEMVSALLACTEGWIAALQLAALSLHGKEDPAELIAAFDGRHRSIADYLLEDVLQRQPEEIREFLYQTAILDRLSAPLCDALTEREDSATILTRLEHANLLLIPLDDRREWYRYHSLFADFLRAQIPETCQSTLHRRACRWFEANGFTSEAIKHALASGDMSEAARVISQATKHTLHEGRLRAALTWLGTLPEAVVRTDSGLSTLKGWALLLAGQTDEAESYTISAESNLPADACPTSRGRLMGLRASLDLVRRDSRSVLQACREALGLIGESDALFRSGVLITLAHALADTGDFGAAMQAFREVYLAARQIGNRFAALHAQGNIAWMLNTQGRRREGIALCQQALQECTDCRGRLLPVAGLLQVWLGMLYYEANELAPARSLLIGGFELCDELAIDRLLPAEGKVVLARAQYALGQTAAAMETIRQARLVCARSHMRVVGATTAAVEADLQLSQGDVAAAARWAEAVGLSPTDPPDPPREQERIVYARLLLAQGRPGDAETVLATLEDSARGGGRFGRLISIRILQALAQDALGHADQAVACLEEALRLAAPEGYLRAFLDQGQPVFELLRKARHSAPGFVDELLDCIESRPPVPSDQRGQGLQGLVEPLTAREMEVLQLLADGLSNREIADRLVVTVGTVKWHAHNIYGKLDAQNRTQAAARARELDLLP